MNVISSEDFLTLIFLFPLVDDILREYLVITPILNETIKSNMNINPAKVSPKPPLLINTKPWTKRMAPINPVTIPKKQKSK